MNLAHDSVWGGHLGRKKTLERIKYFFYWPKIFTEVSDYCKKCYPCQFRKRRKCWDKIPITPIPRPNECFTIVHIDMLGPIQKSKFGCQYVLCVVDQFSRWADAIPMRRITAKNMCEALLQICARTSIPTTVISDNASNFTNFILSDDRVSKTNRIIRVIYGEDNDFGDILECPHRSKDKTKNSDRIREDHNPLIYLPKCCPRASTGQIVPSRSSIDQELIIVMQMRCLDY